MGETGKRPHEISGEPIEVGAAVVIHSGRVLLARRSGGYLHDLWEFPGGKLEPGETPAEAVERELVEELQLRVVGGEVLLVVDHEYPDKKIRLHFVRCSLLIEEENCGGGKSGPADGPPSERERSAWFTPDRFPWEEFCPADKAAAERIPWKKLGKGRIRT